MNQLIQLIAVIIALSVSTAYLIRFYWRKHKAKSGCAACKVLETVNRRSESPNSPAGKPKGSPAQSSQ